jgi:hypothetical protein
MMQTQYLRPDQERAMGIYMDKFGISAGVRVIAAFEKGKSLGKAMIKYRDYRGVKRERNNHKNIQV